MYSFPYAIRSCCYVIIYPIHIIGILQSDCGTMHANIQYFIGNLLHFGNCTWVERKSSQEDGEVFTRSTNRCRIQYWLNSSDYETFQRRWMDLLDCIGPTKSSREVQSQFWRLSFSILVRSSLVHYLLPCGGNGYHLCQRTQTGEKARQVHDQP